ncbi:MAG: type II toxin-antitoxin system RelE/ParE family toxin [Candidatus Nanohalobium sp.]
MDWEVHSEAVEEFVRLPEEDRELVEEKIEARKNRDNPILGQRNVGMSYDNHGEPVHYFKVEEGEKSFRVFFDISENTVVLLGVRERDDDTYFNLREYTKRMK